MTLELIRSKVDITNPVEVRNYLLSKNFIIDFFDKDFNFERKKPDLSSFNDLLDARTLYVLNQNYKDYVLEMDEDEDVANPLPDIKFLGFVYPPIQYDIDLFNEEEVEFLNTERR